MGGAPTTTGQPLADIRRVEEPSPFPPPPYESPLHSVPVVDHKDSWRSAEGPSQPQPQSSPQASPSQLSPRKLSWYTRQKQPSSSPPPPTKRPSHGHPTATVSMATASSSSPYSNGLMGSGGSEDPDAWHARMEASPRPSCARGPLASGLSLSRSTSLEDLVLLGLAPPLPPSG